MCNDEFSVKHALSSTYLSNHDPSVRLPDCALCSRMPCITVVPVSPKAKHRHRNLQKHNTAAIKVLLHAMPVSFIIGKNNVLVLDYSAWPGSISRHRTDMPHEVLSSSLKTRDVNLYITLGERYWENFWFFSLWEERVHKHKLGGDTDYTVIHIYP